VWALEAKRIDIGVDVLQALQFNAEGMDPAALKRYEGGVSVQETLPFGTADRGRRAARGRGANQRAGQGRGVHLRSGLRTWSRRGRHPLWGISWLCLIRRRATIRSKSSCCKLTCFRLTIALVETDRADHHRASEYNMSPEASMQQYGHNPVVQKQRGPTIRWSRSGRRSVWRAKS
jgi:hypothetical protein